MPRRIKDEANASKNDLLLLYDNIKVNNNTIIIDKKNAKKIILFHVDLFLIEILLL